ncbi:serine protease inhibitor [Streptomyces sp. NPDC059979]|uniref:serine protease inhibitor n=1 Tax=Streptomyces sp. NPDC059979 TaxID=3347021 RepID=UPI00367E1107
MSTQEWPELVGMAAEDAAAEIRRGSTHITELQVVPPGQLVTMDFRPDRVRLHVDADGIVSRVPRIG